MDEIGVNFISQTQTDPSRPVGQVGQVGQVRFHPPSKP